MKDRRHKTFVLGIDGATFDIIHPLVERGKLPNMKKVIENGTYGVLNSTVPSLSAPAWVAFMTGKNPGHFGTYHFRKIRIGNYHDIYSQELINSSAFSGSTFFDYLGEMGYRVGVMTVPVTYPPWKVNGFLISGYPCPDPDDHENFTFPYELSGHLPENLNWTENENSRVISKEELRGAEEPRDILNGGLTMMTRRTSYTLKLMKQFKCDFTLLVWGAIDRAQHLLWKYHDSKHILHQADSEFKTYIEQLYCHADKLLGDIMRRIGPQANLFVISDHGFGPRQGYFFHINAWLRHNGYLKLSLNSSLMNNALINALKMPAWRFVNTLDISTKRKIVKTKQSFEISGVDFKKTLVYKFPIDQGTLGLVINLKGRQPLGFVLEEQYEALRSELIDRLSKLSDPSNGKNVVKKCFRKEELYTGRMADEAPDIILVLEDAYLPGSGMSGKLFSQIPKTALEKLNGSHRPEGIFLACGPAISQGKLEEEANIVDFAPTLLYALGEKTPDDMEGKLLRSAFSAERLKKGPIFTERKNIAGVDLRELSAAEQKSMQNKLADLGYL